MNNNEFMAKVTEMVMQDPSMRESLKKLYDELAQIEPSTEQKPDMMYVLTQRVKVATENGEEIYHYHPLVGECLLVPGAVKNQMVCSGNLLELQTLQKSERLSHMCGMREDFQILALKPDEFELLQLLLDETITSIIDNTHMKKMTDGLKGAFVACVVIVRKKEKDGKLYTNYDLKYLIRPPKEKAS